MTMDSSDTDERAEKIKVRKLFAVLWIWYYISGLEYGLIVSSLNSYLQIVGAQPYYLGLGLAAFPFSGLLLATVFGRLTDRLRRILPILLIGIAFSIVGNAIYFFIADKNVVVAGRFLSGIGNSIDGAVMGYAGLIKGPRKRASTYALLLVTKQTGTITVPLWQKLIKTLKASVLPTYSTESTYGLFLTIFWTLDFLLALFLLQGEVRPKKKKEEDGAKSVLLGPKSEIIAISWLPAFINEPFVVALISTFSFIFLQASMETMVTPFNRSYFGWSFYENGLEFMMIGICALIGYSLVKFTSTEIERNGIQKKRLETKYTYLMGVCGCLVVCVSTGIIISQAQFRETWLYASIFMSILIFCISLPLGMVSSAAIIAKNTPDQHQSSTQSVRVACEKTAQILAPLWVSSWGPAETRGITGILIMFPSALFFCFTTGAMYSCWKFLKKKL